MTGRIEKKRAKEHQRLKYLNSLCTSWNENMNPAQLIKNSEDRMLQHRMVASVVNDSTRHHKNNKYDPCGSIAVAARFLRCTPGHKTIVS